jgi:hypothetical protein
LRLILISGKKGLAFLGELCVCAKIDFVCGSSFDLKK